MKIHAFLSPFAASWLLVVAVEATPFSPSNDGRAALLDRMPVLADERPTDSEFAYPVFDRTDAGAIWVHGTNFKARFDRHGFEFIPFLGSDAPKDYPLQLELESARVGSSELAWESDVQPELDGRNVTFRRGALDEVYVVGPSSIDQTFVVHERRTSGDLHVVLRVRSEFEGTDVPSGTVFANERGGVRYGRATTRDASGRHVESTTLRDGSTIDIAVPRREIESASFPLAIDPIVATFQVSDNVIGSALSPDCAYDIGSNRWVVVYEAAYSGNDHDVIAREYLGNGANVNQSTYIDMTSDDWTEPRVADARATHQFLVVATRNQNLIWGRTRDAASAAMGSQFLVSDVPFAGDVYHHPDVSGDARLVAAAQSVYPVGVFRVAWQSQSNGINGLGFTTVSSSGQLLEGRQARAIQFSSSDPRAYVLRLAKACPADDGVASWPGVCLMGSLSNPYLGAFQLTDPVYPQFTLEFSGTIWMPAAGVETDQLPSIATVDDSSLGGRRALYSWVDSAGRAIGRLVDWADPGNVGNWTYGPDTELDTTAGSSQLGLSTGYDGSRFVMTYEQNAQFPDTNRHVYMASVAPNLAALTFTTVDQHTLIADSTKYEAVASYCSMNSVGSASRNGLCVYQLGAARVRTAGPLIQATLFNSH
jgi:hypothetical protein